MAAAAAWSVEVAVWLHQRAVPTCGCRMGQVMPDLDPSHGKDARGVDPAAA